MPQEAKTQPPLSGAAQKTKRATSTTQLKKKRTIKKIPTVDMSSLKNGTVTNNTDEPIKIVTKRLKRNRIIALIIGIIAIGALAYYLAFGLGWASKFNNVTSTTAEVDITDFETKTNSGVEGAKTTINAYYNLLAQQDADGLKNYGFDDASAAMTMKWLTAINYEVDASLVDADVDTMPEPVGVYAGNNLYKISDFMTSNPTGVIKSSITGTTGCEGWTYYDADKMTWVIIDPTIPTATQAAEAGNVSSSTEDNFVNVNLQCSGAYSNPWWSFAMMSVDISSSDVNNTVNVEMNTLDNGMTTIVPDSLLEGCPVAKRVAISQQNTNQNENQEENQNSNQNSNQSNTNQSTVNSISVTNAKGICCIYRGVLSDFNIDRIGAAPLRIDGNVCPVIITVGDEDITPAFAIGTAASEDILRLLNEEEREKYGASESNVNAAKEELRNLSSTATTETATNTTN